MRSTTKTIANNPIRDRQDRTNLAGVEVCSMHLVPAGTRLFSGLESLETHAALAGGKRALQPAFPGAVIATERPGSQPRSSVAGGSYRPWRSPRANHSRAFAAIA